MESPLPLSENAFSSVEAVVLAGGKGTRLAPLTEDTPKPMLKILGKTVLESVFDRIRACGVKKARVTTMYLPWQVESLGSQFGSLSVEYVREQRPLAQPVRSKTLSAAKAIRCSCFPVTVHSILI